MSILGGALGLAASAAVTVGEVNIDPDNEADFIDPGDGVFTDYLINNRYEKDKHVYMTGLTSPTPFQGQSVAFFQLSTPTLLWVADWTAAKVGAKPEIPDSDVTDSDWILMDEHYEPGMLVVAADGTSPLYRISGTFTYGHKNPSDQTIKDINFSRPPWLTNDFDRTVTERDLEGSLIDLG